MVCGFWPYIGLGIMPMLVQQCETDLINGPRRMTSNIQ